MLFKNILYVNIAIIQSNMPNIVDILNTKNYDAS